MQTEQLKNTLEQLLEAARSEGREQVIGSVLAAIGKLAETGKPATNGHAKPKPNGHTNGNGSHPKRIMGMQKAIALALAQSPGLTFSGVVEATGFPASRVSNALALMKRAKRVRTAGKFGTFRYFNKRVG